MNACLKQLKGFSAKSLLFALFFAFSFVHASPFSQTKIENCAGAEFKQQDQHKKEVLQESNTPDIRSVFSGRCDPFLAKMVECPESPFIAFLEWFVLVKYDHPSQKPYLNRQILSSRNHPPTFLS